MPKPARILFPVLRPKMHLHRRNISAKSCCSICLIWKCYRKLRICRDGVSRQAVILSTAKGRRRIRFLIWGTDPSATLGMTGAVETWSDEGFVCIFALGAKIKVPMRPAASGNSPPDCCILLFESLTTAIKIADTQMGICYFWQRMRDSNPRERSQSPVCYRYTNPL